MRYTPEHSQETRERILASAGREFRQRGFAGVGIDGLAKAARVTSGAFYSHFRSKAEAFRAVAVAGIVRLRAGAEHFQKQHGDHWLTHFATYYMSAPHRRDVAGGCAMPSLSTEVERSNATTRAAYEQELLKMASLISEGLPGHPSREAAWPILAMLAGGVVLARAVQSKATAQEIADAVLDALADHPN